MRRYDEPFTGTPNAIGSFAPGGSVASATFLPGGANSAYRWQARTVDSSGRVSSWVEYAPLLVQGYLFAFAHANDLESLTATCAASAGTSGKGSLLWLAGLAVLFAIPWSRRQRKMALR